jgi:hypothetical protein
MIVILMGLVTYQCIYFHASIENEHKYGDKI